MSCVTYYEEDDHRSIEATAPTGDSNIDLILQDEDETDLNVDSFREEYGNVDNHLRIETDSSRTQKSPFRQAIAAVDLLWTDNKMKYLSFINITVRLYAILLSHIH
jgi:hypothetical protein